MTDTEQATPEATPEAPRKLLELERMKGTEIQAVDEIMGGPGQFAKGLEADNMIALFAWVWVSEHRTNPKLTIAMVLDRELTEIVEVIEAGTPESMKEAIEAAASVDPTAANIG